MNIFKNTMKSLSQVPLLKRVIPFTPGETDFEAQLARANYKTPKPKKPVEELVEEPEEKSTPVFRGVTIEESENEELWKIASRNRE